MHQGQLLEELAAELNKLSLPTSIPRRDHSWQGTTTVFTRFTENTKMRQGMRAHFGNGPLMLLGHLTACAKSQVCSRTAGGFMRHRMPNVQLIWCEGVAHMLHESGQPGSILKPPWESLENDGRVISVWAQLGRTWSCAVVHVFWRSLSRPSTLTLVSTLMLKCTTTSVLQDH